MTTAREILKAAKWKRILVQGSLVGGVDPAGNMHIKDWARIPPGHELYSEDTPDTAEEAAAWLAAKFAAPVAVAAEAVEIAAIEPEANDEAHGEAGGETDAKQDSGGLPDTGDAEPGHEPGGAGSGLGEGEGECVGEIVAAELRAADVQIPESQAADGTEAAAQDSVDSGHGSAEEGSPASVDDADAGSAIQRGQVHDEPRPEGAGGGDDDYALDADFAEIGTTADDVAALEDQSAAPEPVEYDRGYEQSSGGVAFFGDDIHIARLAKLGRLAEIARELKAVYQDGWTVSEFASLQNLIVRIERQEAPDDPEGRARFMAISERSRAMNAVDAYQNQREDELEQYAELLKGEDTREAGRAAILAFNPDEGWDRPT